MVLPNMTPAEERRQFRDNLHQEENLKAELQSVLALLGLLDEGKLDREGRPMTPRQIQSLFGEASERSIRAGVTGRVLVRAGVVANSTNRIQQWEVIEAEPKLEELRDQILEDLRKCQRRLGRK